jgi:hypothetical protein
LRILLSEGSGFLIKVLKESVDEGKEMKKIEMLSKLKPTGPSTDYLDLITYTFAKDLMEMS